MKRLLSVVLVACVFTTLICSCSKEPSNTDTPQETTAVNTDETDSTFPSDETYVVADETTVDQASLQDAFIDEIGGSGLTFYSSVRNDNTGLWRVAVIYTSENMVDHAADYYRAYFTADDEVHFICNLGLSTTTRILYVNGELEVTVFEYTDGEEHDANVLPGGSLLNTYYVNIETGEAEEVT